MLFQAFCRQGRLQVLEKGTIQVVTLFFGGVLWSVPREFVTGLSVRHGLFTDTLIIHTAQGQCQADTLIKSAVARVQTLFQHVPLVPLPPKSLVAPQQVHIRISGRQPARRKSGSAQAVVRGAKRGFSLGKKIGAFAKIKKPKPTTNWK